MVVTLEAKFQEFSKKFMGNLLMRISQLSNVRYYNGNREIQGDFCGFEYLFYWSF